jgi:hypothetical protein
MDGVVFIRLIISRIHPVENGGGRWFVNILSNKCYGLDGNPCETEACKLCFCKTFFKHKNISRIGDAFLLLSGKDVKYSTIYIACVRFFCIFAGVMKSLRSSSY